MKNILPTNNSQIIVISNEPARVLFYLSSLGFFTGLVGYFYEKPVLGISVCIGSLFAMNYWRNPVYGWRRSLDMMWVQYLIWLHLYYVLKSPVKQTYFLIQCQGVVFYCVSWYYLKLNKLWMSTICHGGVHLCANISLLLFYMSE